MALDDVVVRGDRRSSGLERAPRGLPHPVLIMVLADFPVLSQLETGGPMRQQQRHQLPEAETIVRPELLAGRAGVPLPWARHFHETLFDWLAVIVGARGVVLLHTVLVGRPSPLLLEVEHWARGCPELADRMQPGRRIVELIGGGDAVAPVVTVGDLRPALLDVAPAVPPAERKLLTAALLVSSTALLADIGDFARVGSGAIVDLGGHPSFGELARAAH